MINSPTPQEFRDMLLDKEQVSTIANLFLTKTLKEARELSSEEYQIVYPFLELTAKYLIDDATKIIFKYAESPIEKIMMSTTLLSLMNTAPLWIIFQPPAPDISSAMKSFRHEYQQCRGFFANYKQVTGKTEFEFLTDLEDMISQGFATEEDRAILLKHHLLYETFGLRNSFHLVVQTSMKDIKIAGKTIRPDMFFWIPSNKNLKILVECDGFQFHSDRNSFSRDRQRDRELQSKGYKVLRFSGQEIYNNPARIGYDLLDYLFRSIGSETGPPSFFPVNS